MKHPAPQQLALYLAWQFDTVLDGHLVRNREGLRDKKFPIIGPRPTHGPSTPLLDAGGGSGPYIYFVYKTDGSVAYVGKSKERTPLVRWIRPNSLTGTHEWTHGTNIVPSRRCPNPVATVERIAYEITQGRGPVQVYYCTERFLRQCVEQIQAEEGVDASRVLGLDAPSLVTELEQALILALDPEWNVDKKSCKADVRLLAERFLKRSWAQEEIIAA